MSQTFNTRLMQRCPRCGMTNLKPSPWRQFLCKLGWHDWSWAPDWRAKWCDYCPRTILSDTPMRVKGVKP